MTGEGTDGGVFEVYGRRIVVAGAGRGIGRFLALQLARSGAFVLACSRTASDLDSLVADGQRHGAAISAVVADLSTVDGVETMVAEAVADLGGVDALVNNAGWDTRRPALDYSEIEFDQLIDINLKSAYFASVAAAKQMIAQGDGGAIVNITSQAGISGSMHRAPYSAAKAGLINLTRALAVEWGPHRIRVNALAPGVTLTDPVRRALESRPGFADEIRERMPMGRPASVEEMSAPIVFLLTRAAAMITGQTLVVDGGWTSSWSSSPAAHQILGSQHTPEVNTTIS
ncbi:NAD(P)-dependent dehydrogenase (short-subunit alcohol dehydrogenase family) [Rhodococcus sp. 27YEA15]|uniref:SDR family NAD(P)-dependent oxidoreductase n=1 Tax=Rhodococcus sp. 27YEA15 TaxID=3156259 RepID=UPI003C7E4F64